MSTPQPTIPTTLSEWSKTEVLRERLHTALRQAEFVAAIAVLRHMNAPRPAPSADLGAVALCHQYHAGWEACLKALSSLPELSADRISKLQKAADLEVTGPWRWAGGSDPKSVQP